MTHGQRVPGGQDEEHRVHQQVVTLQALGQAPRLVLPLVAQHEIDVAQRQRGQRVLGLGLDELAAQSRRVARERLHRRQGEVQRDGLERGDAPRPLTVPAAAARSASASAARSSSASA